MKKLVFVAALSMLLLIGCATNEKENQIQVIDVSYSGLYRESENMDENEFYKRPFTKAGAIFTLNVKPTDDAQVTILPAGVDIDSFNVKINRVEEINAEVNDKKYNIFVEDIVNKDVLEHVPIADRRDDAPFDVCCIYPAVERAKILDIKTVDINTLPEKEIKNIKYLIDINGDINPDIIIVELVNDYNTTRYYLKENGSWKLLKEVLPL
jgi:hypothetical protein